MSERERELVLQALISARSSIETAILALDKEEQQTECPHKKRIDTGGMGQKPWQNWYCPDCGMEVQDGKTIVPGKSRVKLSE